MQREPAVLGLRRLGLSQEPYMNRIGCLQWHRMLKSSCSPEFNSTTVGTETAVVVRFSASRFSISRLDVSCFRHSNFVCGKILILHIKLF